MPVRAQEAWLLFDEPAIRRAAGNPRSQIPLDLPALSQIEEIADPKGRLLELLRIASGETGRRRRRFRERAAIHRVAELIEDFIPLRELSAFRAFERDLTEVISIL